MPKKRPYDRPEGVQFWGPTDAIETRIRRLSEQVKALRQELTTTNNRLTVVNDKRLPLPRNPGPHDPQARSRKRR